MPAPTDLRSLVDIFLELARVTVPVLAGLALLVFLWGLARFIFNIGESDKNLEDGKKLIVWGLIALFIMAAFWSILAFAYRDVGFTRPFGPPILLPPNQIN